VGPDGLQLRTVRAGRRRPVVDREHGGKELHDDALLNADLAGSVFALGVLAARDMGYLWDMIVGVAAGHGPWPRATVPAGSAIRHGPGRHPPHPQGVGGGGAGHDRAPQPGGLRTRRAGPGQGLRL